MIFSPVSIAYATQIIAKASPWVMDIPFLGSDTWTTTWCWRPPRAPDVQLYVSTFYQEGGTPSSTRASRSGSTATASAKTNNGGDDTLSAVTAMGYDAYYVALEAIKAADSADPAAFWPPCPA